MGVKIALTFPDSDYKSVIGGSVITILKQCEQERTVILGAQYSKATFQIDLGSRYRFGSVILHTDVKYIIQLIIKILI